MSPKTLPYRGCGPRREHCKLPTDPMKSTTWWSPDARSVGTQTDRGPFPQVCTAAVLSPVSDAQCRGQLVDARTCKVNVLVGRQALPVASKLLTTVDKRGLHAQFGDSG